MDIAVRAALVYAFLYGMTRVLGRRELAQTSPFELLLLVIVGDVVQQGITSDDTSVTGAIIAVSTIGALSLSMSYAAYRWKPAAEALEGRPVVVVHLGQVLPDALRRQRMTRGDVESAAREQGIADLADVAIAVLEPDGQLSFITEDRRRQPAPRRSGAS
jgi:uncharacterized membrane protein YcaP (DUF421 family)